MISIIKSGLLFTSLVFTVSVNGQTKTVNTLVEGNCGMCKDRIEEAAKSDPNVTSATWSPDSKILNLTFNSKKTSEKAVLKKIAKVGHDNKQYRASNKTYDALHSCCQYDRPDYSKKLAAKANLDEVNELK